MKSVLVLFLTILTANVVIAAERETDAGVISEIVVAYFYSKREHPDFHS